MSLQHFYREVSGQLARFHLRVEADGSGLLLANASAALRLSESGVRIARLFLEGKSEQEVAKQVAQHYRLRHDKTIHGDVQKVGFALSELVDRPYRFPLHTLEPLSSKSALSAPLCADISATRGEKVAALLAKLWELGIPQVVWVLQRDTPFEELCRWIQRAEDLGLICGVRGCASAIALQLDSAASAGLDHLAVYCAGFAEQEHDAYFGKGDYAALATLLKRAQELEVFASVHLMLTQTTFPRLRAGVQDFVRRGVNVLGVTALVSEHPSDSAFSVGALLQAGVLATEVADALGVRIVWTPAIACTLDAEFSRTLQCGPRTSGEACVRLNAQGDIFAPSGPKRVLGNLLSDSSQEIWAHPEIQRVLSAAQRLSRCARCPELSLCDMGCPLERAQWSWGDA